MQIFSSVTAEVSAELVAVLPDFLSQELCSSKYYPAAQSISNDISSLNHLSGNGGQSLINDNSRQGSLNMLGSKAEFLQNQLSLLQFNVSVICSTENHIHSLKVCGSSWEQMAAVYLWLNSWADKSKVVKADNVEGSYNCDFIENTKTGERNEHGDGNVKPSKPPSSAVCRPVTRSLVNRSKSSHIEAKNVRTLNSAGAKKARMTKKCSSVEDGSVFRNQNAPSAAESDSDSMKQVTTKTIEIDVRRNSVMSKSSEKHAHKLLNRCKKVPRNRVSTIAMLQEAAERNMQEYRCDLCDYVSTKERYLLFHKLRVHSKREHQCTICQRSFGVLKDLNQHLKFHNERFCCEHCGKTLKSRYALMLHIARIHNGAAPRQVKHYLCTLCGKMCRSKTEYTTHRNKEHLRIQPYHCEICDAGFFARSNLRAHEKIHSDIRTFKCKLCDKAFKQRQGLRIHLSVHAVNRPYQCERCSKSFTQRSALVRHTRTHTSSRPYACFQCLATFNDCSILRRHMIGIHKVNPEELKEYIKTACGKARILEREGSVDNGLITINEIEHHELPFGGQSVVDETILPYVYDTDSNRHLTSDPGSIVSTLPNSNMLMGVLAKSDSMHSVNLCSAADQILIFSGYDSNPLQVCSGTGLISSCPDTSQYLLLNENWRSWHSSNADNSMN